MTLRELESMARITDTLKALGVGDSGLQPYELRNKAYDLFKTYAEIFIDQCERHRENVKYELKK